MATPKLSLPKMWLGRYGLSVMADIDEQREYDPAVPLFTRCEGYCWGKRIEGVSVAVADKEKGKPLMKKVWLCERCASLFLQKPHRYELWNENYESRPHVKRLGNAEVPEKSDGRIRWTKCPDFDRFNVDPLVAVDGEGYDKPEEF
jgi:hypothetical protein